MRKETEVRGQGYKAVTHDQVTGMTRGAMIEYGVILVPSLVDGVSEETGAKTSKGATIVRYVGTYDIKLVNMDEPSDFIVMRMQAHALDHGDKAPGKALSYATKMVLLKVLSIETGEDDESRYSAEPDPQVSTDQVDKLIIAAEAAGRSKDQLEAYVMKVFGTPSLFQMTEGEYLKVLEKVEGAKK